MMHPYNEDYLNSHIEYVRDTVTRDRNRKQSARGSPRRAGNGLRGRLGRLLVTLGARFLDEGPAFIGDRVVVLEPPRANPCPEEPCLEPAA